MSLEEDPISPRSSHYRGDMSVPIRRILATSGGFVPGRIQQTARLGDQLLHALTLTGATRPKVCLLQTAMGDDRTRYAMGFEAFNVAGCEVAQLTVFPQPSDDPEALLNSSDLVWVGGGSVANLLALWELHGIGRAMRSAWENGVMLGGVSAGSICWHTGGTTDSYGPKLQPVTNGLALLTYANCVHYDSEEERRPLLHELVGNGTLSPVAYATDDRTGILYEGQDAVSVLTDFPVDPINGPAAYLVERTGPTVRETRLTPGPLGR